ncbi:peptidase M75 [Rhodobacterales bacterium HKCCE2091]|nr:peptidase M75 [Rhodobacterales bacterium HKCCE2091]
MRPILIALFLSLPAALHAQSGDEYAPASRAATDAVTEDAARAIVASAIDGHVLPGFDVLAAEAEALAGVASTDCIPGSEALRTAWNAAFDAWIRVSHLRFGPAETDNRAFALAFWPDTRGATPSALGQLLSDEDPVIGTETGFATVSVAARGFYAMEFLLYDDVLSAEAQGPYGCALVRAAAVDIAATAEAIRDDWRDSYAGLMRTAGDNAHYQSAEEALRALYGALDQGLEFDADVRLGRPLGTFDRPRPARAEARRSLRSLRNLVLSVESLRELAAILATAPGADAARVDAAFATALDRAARLDDPAFAGVDDPQGRLRVEVLQQAVQSARDTVRAEIGPALGVAAGFNSLDGD